MVEIGILMVDSAQPKEFVVERDGQKSESQMVTSEYLNNQLKLILKQYTSSELNFDNTMRLSIRLENIWAILQFNSMLFLACHEYAHILAGDIGDVNANNNITVSEIWQRELSADLLGYKLYSEALKHSPSNFIMSFSSPISCISVMDLIDLYDYYKDHHCLKPEVITDYDEMKKYITIHGNKVSVSNNLNQIVDKTLFYPSGELRIRLILDYDMALHFNDYANMSAEDNYYFNLPISIADLLLRRGMKVIKN